MALMRLIMGSVYRQPGQGTQEQRANRAVRNKGKVAVHMVGANPPDR